MQCTEKGKSGPAEHHIMKMCNHKIGIMQMNIGCQRSNHQSGKAADHELKNKGHGIQHRSFNKDGTLVKGCNPVEHFDG